MLKTRFKKKGVVLVIVLATILVVICFAIATLTLILSHGRFSTHQVNRVKAYYAALAGVNLAMEELRVGTAGWVPSPDIATSSPVVKSLCSSGCDIIDPDIPFTVTINIYGNGTTIYTAVGPPYPGRKITASVNYTSLYEY